MSSLENQLETAYAAVAKANEPALGPLTARPSALILAQAPNPGDDEQDKVEQVPVPYWLVTAKTERVALANHRGQPVAFAIRLTNEVGDNAQPASADGGRLDALFGGVSRPLSYKTLTDESTDPPTVYSLFDVLGMAVPGLTVLGIEPDSIETDMSQEGSIVKRMISAVFLCKSSA